MTNIMTKHLQGYFGSFRWSGGSITGLRPLQPPYGPDISSNMTNNLTNQKKVIWIWLKTTKYTIWRLSGLL